MGTMEKRDHQPEPWTQDGRYILDASGWTLASARFPADARRIIAAINAVRGIPTDALESWGVNVIGEQARNGSAAGLGAGGGESVSVTEERRSGPRRHGDRRSALPRLRDSASTPVYQEDAGENER